MQKLNSAHYWNKFKYTKLNKEKNIAAPGVRTFSAVHYTSPSPTSRLDILKKK